MVEFTETFIIKKEQTADWASYRLFIESLRRKTKLIYKSSHGRPVLHPEADPPTGDRWFDIVLQTSTRQIKLRIRRSNLYLDGYQVGNSQWFEFGSNIPNAKHLITGSTFLGFGGDYTNLQRYARQNREDIKLGWKQLQEAVDNLADPRLSDQEKAKALIVVIQMICESIRFRSISKQLATKFQDGTAKDNKAELPPLWMVEQETSWAHISEELLHMDSNPNYRFQPPKEKTGIKTAEQAVEAIAMIKYFKFPRNN